MVEEFQKLNRNYSYQLIILFGKLLLLVVLPVHWLIFICWKICIYFWHLLCIILITIHNQEIFYCVRDNIILVYTSMLLVTTPCLLKKKKKDLARQMVQQSWELLRLRHWLSHKFCSNSCRGDVLQSTYPIHNSVSRAVSFPWQPFSDINCKYICCALFLMLPIWWVF